MPGAGWCCEDGEAVMNKEPSSVSLRRAKQGTSLPAGRQGIRIRTGKLFHCPFGILHFTCTIFFRGNIEKTVIPMSEHGERRGTLWLTHLNLQNYYRAPTGRSFLIAVFCYRHPAPPGPVLSNIWLFCILALLRIIKPMRYLTVIAFILLVVCHFEVVSQPCLPEGITFSTQSQVDSFPINYPNCTEIEGDVFIQGDEIVNLWGLSVVSEIGGMLNINTRRLKTLEGLESLQYIHGDLRVRSNDSLMSPKGLEGLVSVGDDFWFSGNYSMTTMSGLEHLTSIGGYFISEYNYLLPDFEGLNLLSSIGENFEIRGHDVLKDFSGLDSLAYIGGCVIVRFNDSLSSFDGLNNLQYIGECLLIEDNPMFLDMTAIGNLNTIGTVLSVVENPLLVSLEGLEGIKSINRYIEIYNCPLLRDLGGLDSLNFVAESLTIHGIDSLIDFTGLNNLCRIDGGFVIEKNINLQSFAGIENLSYVGSSLKIYDNDKVQDLTGFENLDTLGGLNISGNSSLQNIVALNFVNDTLIIINIVGNDSLVSLESLENTKAVHNYCFVSSNLSLQSLLGLHNISSVGSLHIDENPCIESLIGLAGLKRIKYFLTIRNNDSLLSLSGLDSLHWVGGTVWIDYNDALTTLESLYELDSIKGNLSITNNGMINSLSGLDSISGHSISSLFIHHNPMLSTCHVTSICDYLVSPSGTVEIYDNYNGCNSQAEVEEACTVGIPEQQTASQLSTYPNPFTTSTTIEYELSEPSHVQLTIYNAIGGVVYQVEDRMMLQGSHTVTWSPSHLPEGMYYVVLRSEGGVSVVKMVKQ